MRFSIHLRLVAVIATLTVALIGSLTVFFHSQQVGELRQRLDAKATTYGHLLSAQVVSAIAFDDRETARAIFAPMTADRDINGIALYTDRGELLHAVGRAPSPRVTAADGPVVLERGPGRIIAVASVVSQEGPRGTLVVEFSTARIDAASARITRTAILVGGGALLVGVVVAWLIGRSLARRLRAIADVAGAVARGDLDQVPVDDRGRDEIGALAGAFGSMLTQIKGLIHEKGEMSRKEQERLERMVGRRTRELDRRNGDLQLVLDHIEQGFFTVDREGRMSAERSAAVDVWLGPPPASGMLCDYVAAFDLESAGWFEVNWQSVSHGLLPLDLALAQLPQRFVVGGRTLGFGYKAITSSNGTVRRILVVISDLTATVARERVERDMRETTALLSRLISDRHACLELHDEAGELVAAIVAGAAEPATIVRELHTLKGNAATHGLDSIAELCHEMETTLATDGMITVAHVETLAQRWETLSQAVRPFFAGAVDQVVIDEQEHRALLIAVERGMPHPALREVIDELRHEPVRSRLERFADQARALAERLGKGPVDVRIECGLERLPRETWTGFWTVFGHAVRNAVDHGIEAPEERGNRPDAGQLVLRARRDDSRFFIEVQDHGRGIDWDKLAVAARGTGRPAATREDLIEAMFTDQVTTRDVATETSGRGVGMGILRDTCRAMGGEVQVWSEPGAGTRLRFEWPDLRVSSPRDARSVSGAVPVDPRARPSLLRRSSADHR